MTSLVTLGRYQLVLLKAERKECSLLGRISAWLKELKEYREVARQRKQLAQLPDYLLKDIGISRADALKEADKPFWK